MTTIDWKRGKSVTLDRRDKNVDRGLGLLTSDSTFLLFGWQYLRLWFQSK